MKTSELFEFKKGVKAPKLTKKTKNTAKEFAKAKEKLEPVKPMEESGLQYHTGVKKHGKKYMRMAAELGRKGASQEELGRLKDKYSKAYKEEGVAEAGVKQLPTQDADYSKYDTDTLKMMLRPGILNRNEARFKALIRKELQKREQQGVAEGEMDRILKLSGLAK